MLQSAPNENRKNILNELLRVPKITSLTNLEMGGNALLGALGRARHQTALRKVPYVIELLEIALLTHKVVVFAHHRDVQEIVFRHFRDQAVALNGDTPAEERTKNVLAFQNDPNIRLFVGSIRASGLGISLTAASHVVFVEMDWSPSIIQQAEDRCHRVGQKASVLVQYLYFKGTIDEHLSQLLVEKQRTLSAAIEELPEDSPARWVFNFGKHSGKIISDVAAEDPGYLKWLVDSKIHLNQKLRSDATSNRGGSEGLTNALIELGFLKPQTKHLPANYKYDKDEKKYVKDWVGVDFDKEYVQEADFETPFSTFEEKEAGNFVIKFGRFSGTPLKDIPRQYLEWVYREDISIKNPGLTEALQVFLASSSNKRSGR
jgi:uncharacterized protein (DUF3820 family)